MELTTSSVPRSLERWADLASYRARARAAHAAAGLDRAGAMGQDKGYLKYLALVGEVGLVLVASIGGGLLAGVLLDRWLGVSPAFTLALLLAGIAAGFIKVYRLLLPRDRK